VASPNSTTTARGSDAPQHRLDVVEPVERDRAPAHRVDQRAVVVHRHLRALVVADVQQPLCRRSAHAPRMAVARRATRGRRITCGSGISQS